MKNLYEPGQMIETTIVAISNDTIFIDLGLKSEGFIDKAELTDENGNLKVKEGDKIKAYFTGSQHDELHFTTKLSGPKADKELLENAWKNGIPVEGHVTKEIKGGFEVLIGTTRAFCPYSQMGYRQKKEAGEYVGQHLTFKISEYKNEGKNIVLSNRALLEEQAQAELNALSENIKVGDTVKGTVISIESYGAFINLNGFQALLPISEVSRTRISNLNDVLSVGQEITAKVISADWKRERVSLSTKALEADPWDSITEKYSVGSSFDGKVSRVADFGLFINMENGVDGLVHVSKLGLEKNTNLKKVYKTGDSLAVTIDSIDSVNHKISLSPVISNEEEKEANDYLSKQSDDGETYNPFAALLKK